jgi:hypothetical protein
MTTFALLEGPSASPQEIREAFVQVVQNKLSTILRQKTRWEGDEVRAALARTMASTLSIFERQNCGFPPTQVTPHGHAHAA